MKGGGRNLKLSRIYIPINRSEDSLGSVISVCMLLYAPSTIVLNFVIGVAANNLISKIMREDMEEGRVLTVKESTINQLTKEFQDMKKGFSPFLFLFYVTKCSLLVAFSYDIGNSLFNILGNIQNKAFIHLFQFNGHGSTYVQENKYQ